MLYRCASCNRELVTRSSEATEDGRFPEVVSYVAVLREPDTDPAYCCAECAEPHPGKFEGNHGRHAVGIANILYAWSLDGSDDDRMYSEGWGSCQRLGRFLLIEDSRGFVTFEEHANEEAASKQFDVYYSEGWGATEDDAYISDDRGRYSVSFEGKHIGTFERESQARAAVSIAMRKSGYYPSVWIVNERGTLSSTEVW